MKRLFLVHIPKTAGTAINDALSAVLPSLIHIESKPDSHPRLREDLTERYVSGHLTAPRVLKLLNRDDWFVFTFVRNPVEHLISHLKWCQHIAKAPGLERYDQITQEVCTTLAQTDLSDTQGLSSMMERLPQARRFFDNCQTRYLAGYMGADLIGTAHVNQALEIANQLDYVGISEKLDEGMDVIRRAADLPDLTIERANVARTGARPDFSQEEVLNWYRLAVRFDSILYANLQATSERPLVPAQRVAI